MVEITPDILNKFYGAILYGDDCWNWQWSVNPKGYGKFCPKHGQICQAHRMMYELWHGVKLTPDQKMLHSCDNPRCVNPRHLRIGTDAENAADRQLRERGRSLLTESQVASIKECLAQGLNNTHIGRKFRVSRKTVCRIKQGKYCPGFGPLKDS